MMRRCSPITAGKSPPRQIKVRCRQNDRRAKCIEDHRLTVGQSSLTNPSRRIWDIEKKKDRSVPENLFKLEVNQNSRPERAREGSSTPASRPTHGEKRRGSGPESRRWALNKPPRRHHHSLFRHGGPPQKKELIAEPSKKSAPL